MMNWNRMLSEINEAIDMAKATLDAFGEDEQMVAQLKDLVIERSLIIHQMKKQMTH